MIVATYNVHRCIGRDGRCDPSRVAAVIAELDADVVGLQEVGGETDQLGQLATLAGFHAVAGPTLRYGSHRLGNALLTRRAPREVRFIDLSFSGREPRGAIDADLDTGPRSCRTIVTHFGLRGFERRHQVEILLANVIAADGPDLLLVLGDLNEWLGPARVLKRLRGNFACPGAPSFPTFRPVFALDRVLVRPASALRAFRVHDSPLARLASDHFPARAEVSDLGASP